MLVWHCTVQIIFVKTPYSLFHMILLKKINSIKSFCANLFPFACVLFGNRFISWKIMRTITRFQTCLSNTYLKLCQNKKGQTFDGMLIFESFFFESESTACCNKRIQKWAFQQTSGPYFVGALSVHKNFLSFLKCNDGKDTSWRCSETWVLQCSCLQNMQDVQIIFVNKTLHIKGSRRFKYQIILRLSMYSNSHAFSPGLFWNGLFHETICAQ